MKRIILTLTLALFTLPMLNAQDLPVYVPTEGLVAYYPFNGNANDESGNENNGVVDGATLTTDRFENNENAYNFDGLETFIILPNDFFNGTENGIYTISFWTKYFQENTTIFYKGGSWKESDISITSEKKVEYSFKNGTNSTSNFLTSNTSLERDKWYNITIIHVSGEIKLYINGTFETQLQINDVVDWSTSINSQCAGVGMHFGKNYNNCTIDRGYYGVIDDFGIWDRGLSEQEIQNIYNSSNGDILLNGTVSAENNQIKNVADPTHGKDAVTKDYLLEKIAQLQDQIDALQASSGFETVTDQDGNSYPYLTYGNQVWTVKNAEVVTYRDGTPIPRVSSYTEWRDLETGAWCYYDNDPSKGKLYNWFAVNGIHDAASLSDASQRKAFAPEGWHVPADDEWTTLENYLVANGYNYDGTPTGNKIAKAMASTTGWNISTSDGAPGNDQSLNNSSGFNAFPVGIIYSTGDFEGEGTSTSFWSYDLQFYEFWRRSISINNDGVHRDSYGSAISPKNGFSVRFVRD